MPYPTYSYLDEETMRAALDLARVLQAAAESIGRLTNGGAVGGGRRRDKEQVVQDWIGPTRDTFELLFDNERESAAHARQRLTEEADGWAGFWATATNARNDRLYDEAVHRYELTLDDYRRRLSESADAGLSERPPHAPVRSPPVSTPTRGTDYRSQIVD